MSASSAAPARAAHATDLDRLAIDTIRTLSMDAVEAAKSGHPGTPMALAPSPSRSGRSFSATTRPTPPGPTATASSSRAAMRRCSSIH